MERWKRVLNNRLAIVIKSSAKERGTSSPCWSTRNHPLERTDRELVFLVLWTSWSLSRDNWLVFKQRNPCFQRQQQGGVRAWSLASLLGVVSLGTFGFLSAAGRTSLAATQANTKCASNGACVVNVSQLGLLEMGFFFHFLTENRS